MKTNNEERLKDLSALRMMLIEKRENLEKRIKEVEERISKLRGPDAG